MWVAALGAACTCGSRERTPDPEAAAAGQAKAGAAGADPVQEIAPVPMGVTDLAAFSYSTGPGREAMSLARQADRENRTAAVIEHARAALAADPGHLEAHWYLAMALARQRAYGEVAEHLSAAVAGDWIRWGERSLDIKALSGFYDTPEGRGFREAARGYREEFRALIAESVLVVGRRGRPWTPTRSGDGSLNHRAEIYAYHLPSRRYVRLSRSDGTLVGFLASPDSAELAFASYRAVWQPPDDAPVQEPYIRTLDIGTIDLDHVSTARPRVTLDGVAELWLGYLPAPADPAGGATPGPVLRARLLALVRSPAEPGQPSTLRTYELDMTQGRAVLTSTGTHPGPAGEPGDDTDPTPMLGGDVLHVAYDRVERLRIPIDGVLADWDEHGAAGAFRLERTRKTVTLSGGVLANGHSMSWSPARSRLAFADLPGDPCDPGPSPPLVTLYVVEAATGDVRPLASTPGLQAPEWVDEQHLSFADPGRADAAVVIMDVTTAEPTVTLATRGGLGTSHLAGRHFPTPGCAAPP